MVDPIDGEHYLVPKTEGQCFTAAEISATGVRTAISL